MPFPHGRCGAHRRSDRHRPRHGASTV